MWFLALVLIAGIPPTLRAHDFSTSHSVFEVEGDTVRVSLTLSAGDLHQTPAFDRDGDGRVSAAEIDASGDLLARMIQELYVVEAPDAPGSVTVESSGVDAETGLIRLDMTYRFSHDVTDLTVASNLDRLTHSEHRHLLQIGDQDNVRFAVLTADSGPLTIDYAAGIPLWRNVLEFTRMGVEHILSGYDHLAFLAGILLIATTWTSVVKVVTFFTLAHSITLVAATTGLVSLPSQLIESLIALSIVYIAIENFTGKVWMPRQLVTFAFGLVHGFGFSNVLSGMGLKGTQLGLSLFTFNVGVEIGQVAFVLLLFPIVRAISKKSWSNAATAAGSVTIMFFGFYWFVQRAFSL